MTPVRKIFFSALCTFCFLSSNAQTDITYAEKLGYPKGAKVIIMHVDDAGMSFDSNEGAINALEKGVSSSVSVMMPCPWVPSFVHYLSKHPQTDAGLHLTLTSEWKEYRWGPLAGKSKVPGLVDNEGDLWPDVPDVVKHATADEVEMEIRAQLDRALQMGFHPTHLDSHMGTLFGSGEFIQRYLKVGMETHIPVMLPGGHNTMIAAQIGATGSTLQMVRMAGQQIWKAGLPVLDDLYNSSYDWKLPAGTENTPANWRAMKITKYIEALKAIRPGVTMVIMHCTAPTEVFSHISESGPTRRGDMEAMMSDELKDFIKKEGIIITTWRELKERRDKVKE